MDYSQALDDRTTVVISQESKQPLLCACGELWLCCRCIGQVLTGAGRISSSWRVGVILVRLGGKVAGDEM